MSRILSLVATAALTLTVGVGAVQAQNQDFRALARLDLQAARDELAANHPATVVRGGPSESFRAWLDAGLQEALGKVGQVNSGDAHAYLMRYYSGGFRDSNIAMTPSFEGMGPYFGTNWPGFTTGWRGGRYVVTYVKPGTRSAPRVGDAVTACNLIPIEEFARAKLDRWEGNLETEAGRVTSAPYLMWNRNNPFTAGVPSMCSFQSGRGRPRDIQLRPTPLVPGDLETAYRATVFMPPATPLSIETVNGRPWVNVHSFADSAGWDGFNAQVEAQAAALRGPQGFVLDLRAASGSSVYTSTARGYGMANRIWTPEFTVSRQPSAGALTYRATPGNRRWYSDTLGRMEADPRFVQESMSVIEQTREIVAAFDAAIGAGQPTFALAGRAAVPDSGLANPVAGPVVVLVDAGCSGGCLDTLDLLARLPNVRIAGSTTATDTIFIEPTQLRLPSNFSDLSYGHKAWTARPRGNNQPFTPGAGLTYTGNPADETAVRTWVGTLFGG